MATYATTDLTEAADYKKVTTAGGFRINGLGGNDIITMSPPASSTTVDTSDYLDGGNGNDTLTAALTDDILAGGAGDDILKAGDGKDFLYGDEGGDLNGDGLP